MACGFLSMKEWRGAKVCIELKKKTAISLFLILIPGSGHQHTNVWVSPFSVWYRDGTK